MELFVSVTSPIAGRREEITALPAIPGFVAGIAHSAALQLDDE